MGTPWMHPITDASAWTPADLDADRSWELELSSSQAATLVSSAEKALAEGRELHDIDRGNFAVGGLETLIDAIGSQVRDGRGMAVLHGIPVEELGGIDALPLIERVYWGLLSHLGTGITQNSDATLIHYVTDGALRPNQGTRGVGFPQQSPLHVDLTDCVSLLCIRQAPNDPPSWLASSTSIHNVFLERHPELLEVLYRGFEWDRLEEHGPGEDPATPYRVPVFSEVDGLVSCRYNRYWMGMARKRLGRSQDPDDKAALDLFDRIADELHYNLRFETGDVQFVNNYTVLHGRDDHSVEPDATFNRLLMRIWVDFDEPRPTADPAVIRYGIVRHGNLGWNAEQLREGIPAEGHPRSDDGRPLVDA